jgi:hypothetical protein
MREEATLSEASNGKILIATMNWLECDGMRVFGNDDNDDKSISISTV